MRVAGEDSQSRSRRNRSSSRKKRETTPEDSDEDEDEEFTAHKSFVASPNKTESKSEETEKESSRKRELESEDNEVIKRNKPSGAPNYRQNYLSIIQEEEEIMERLAAAGSGSPSTPVGSRPASIYGSAVVFKPSAAALKKAMEKLEKRKETEGTLPPPPPRLPESVEEWNRASPMDAASSNEAQQEENILLADRRSQESRGSSSVSSIDNNAPTPMDVPDQQPDTPTPFADASLSAAPNKYAIYAKPIKLKDRLLGAINNSGTNLADESQHQTPVMRPARSRAPRNKPRMPEETTNKTNEGTTSNKSESMVGRFFRSLSRRSNDNKMRSTSVPPKKKESSEAPSSGPAPPRRVGSVKGTYSRSDLVSAVGTKLEVRTVLLSVKQLR